MVLCHFKLLTANANAFCNLQYALPHIYYLSKQIFVALSYFILPLGVNPEPFVSAKNSLLMSHLLMKKPHMGKTVEMLFLLII